MRSNLDQRLKRTYHSLLWAAVTHFAPAAVRLDDRDPIFGAAFVPGDRML
jgi:hypothetical protein